MATPIDVVIMAAGKGTRMKSALPKVLHRLGGRALLRHVIDCAALLSARQAVVITGHGAAEVEAKLEAAANGSVEPDQLEALTEETHRAAELAEKSKRRAAKARVKADDAEREANSVKEETESEGS